MIRSIYREACGSHLYLDIDHFLKFCRRTEIVPDLGSVLDLRSLFKEIVADAAALNLNQFRRLLVRIASHNQVQLHMLLAKIAHVFRIDTAMLQLDMVAVGDGNAVAATPPILMWTSANRAAIESIFDYYCRRADTGQYGRGRRRSRTLSGSALNRLLRDYNGHVPDRHWRIHKSHVAVVVAKFTGRTSTSGAVLDLGQLALLIEWHAGRVSTTLDLAPNQALDQIVTMMKSASIDQIQMRPAANPLLDQNVCAVLVQAQAAIQRLYERFATSPVRAGLGLDQHDLGTLSITLDLVPRLVSARQLAWIWTDMRTGRPQRRTDADDGPDLLTLDEFMEVIARIAMTAFDQGKVLGRDCQRLSKRERCLLLLHYMDIKYGGTFLDGSSCIREIPARVDDVPSSSTSSDYTHNLIRILSESITAR